MLYGSRWVTRRRCCDWRSSSSMTSPGVKKWPSNWWAGAATELLRQRWAAKAVGRPCRTNTSRAL
eukprot:1141994-Prorocentrum_lima.AAC.1